MAIIKGEKVVEVDPKDFGAKCDGVTDDALAIQKAIDWAVAQLPVDQEGIRYGSIKVAG